MSRPTRAKVLPFSGVRKRKRGGGNGNHGVERRLRRLEISQGETNRRLGRLESHLVGIESTLASASRIFEAMEERLESLEGAIGLVVERLDQLIEGTTRERTRSIERMALVQARIERIELDLQRRSDR